MEALIAETEDSMAKADEIEKHLTRSEHVAEFVIILLLAWLGAGTKMLFDMHGDIQAIKQKLDDRGLGSIVSSLEHPKSQQQLAANLSLVASEVRVARQDGKKPNNEKLARLSSAVKEVVATNPELPETWQAAFQLVSYRSQSLKESNQASLRSCLDSPIALAQYRNTIAAADKHLIQLPKNPDFMIVSSNCVLNLDDDGSFVHSAAWRFFEEVRKRFPENRVKFSLQNATIVYSGGPMIPIDGLGFVNCVFDFRNPASVPPRAGQLLAGQLLSSSPEMGEVKLWPIV
jgi:hypothetical protein